jgi:hypothetical protein
MIHRCQNTVSARDIGDIGARVQGLTAHFSRVAENRSAGKEIGQAGGVGEGVGDAGLCQWSAGTGKMGVSVDCKVPSDPVVTYAPIASEAPVKAGSRRETDAFPKAVVLAAKTQTWAPAIGTCP